MHRTIVMVDVAGFGSMHRTRPELPELRAGMYRAVNEAFAAAGVPLDDCLRQDAGDGLFILAPPTAPKSTFVESLPEAMANALSTYNQKTDRERLRLRMAIHAGEVTFDDDHGISGASVNFASRLLDAPALKSALVDSPGVLALIVSEWFYQEVVRHSASSRTASYRQVEVTVKETSAIAWISLPDHPYVPHDVRTMPPDRTESVPRQLPVYTPHFVERSDALKALTTRLKDWFTRPDTFIVRLVGTGGAGKTTLVSQWAHQLADQWPDGQLYVNLRGFDPLGAPVKPAEALHGFLEAMGVPPEGVPEDPVDRERLYRDMLSERRALVVLDNVRDPEDVRLLIPPGSPCLFLVISRDYLKDPIETASSVTLDVLSAAEAATFMTRFLGHERVTAEPEAAEKIIETCGRLPLALTLAAARAANNPQGTLTALATELDNALDQTGGTDHARAAFWCSYSALSPKAANLFRVLGTTAGPDVDLVDAARLAGLDIATARTMITELTRARLLDEYLPGRYRFHDSLRAFAIDLEPTTGNRSASSRHAEDQSVG